MVDRRGPDECWPWKGFIKPNGHGLTTYKSSSIHASRKAWILTYGFISGDLCVNHRCDYARCCNPKHMYLGTRIDNMIDRFAKTPPDQRGPRGRPRMLTKDQIEALFIMRSRGAILKECAKHFGVHVATIQRIVGTRGNADRWARSRRMPSIKSPN